MAETPIPTVQERRDFFISYTGKDRAWAEWIAWQLEEAGYSTLLQAWDFRPGGNFVLDMNQATQHTERTLAVLSPDYVASPFTPAEWAEAFRRDPKGEQGFLVPVRVRSCDITGLLGPIVYIDLVDQDADTAKRTLLAGIQHQRRKPVQAPAFPSVFHTLPTPSAFPGALLHSEDTRLKSSRFGAPFPAVWNVSRRHTAFFTGRDHQLEELSQRFTKEHGADLVYPQAITGLGGLGKTQTAAEYAYRYRGDYHAVLWLKAERQEDLVVGFRVLADQLKLPLQHVQERESLITLLQEWFMTQADWLLIFDNADDLAVVTPFLPKAARGHILLTTRTSAMNALAQPLELQPLGPEDGALCILRRAGSLKWNEDLHHASSASVHAAHELSLLMGGLPLALEQAGAYIEDTGCGVSRYLETYRQHRLEIQRLLHGTVPEYHEPVASAWTISREIVERSDPAAAEILRLCAFLAPDAIPDEIFLKGASALGPVLGPIAANAMTFDHALGVLRRYSLLKREVDHETDIPRLSIHPVMQGILKDDMDISTQRLWAERAVRAVSQALPSVEWPIIQAHVRYCIQLVEQWNMTFCEAEQLRLRLEERRDTQ